jgi:hypothetical protein
MRWLAIQWLCVGCLLAAGSALAGTGRVVKVLPHFLDAQGRHSLSPSLYERDAYQAMLRQHPEKRSGLRFDVQWKGKGPFWEPLKLVVELRGIAQGTLPRELTLEKPVEPPGWLGSWSQVVLDGEAYRNFGEVTAWRVTLWEGQQLLGERKSFLW